MLWSIFSADVWSSLYIHTVLFFPIFWSAASSCLGLSRLHLGYLFLCCSLETIKAVSRGISGAHLVCLFPISQGSFFFPACCPGFWKLLFHFFSFNFFLTSSRRISLVPIILSRLGTKVSVIMDSSLSLWHIQLSILMDSVS